MDNLLISNSAQADIVVHQEIRIFLNRLLRQPVCNIHDGLIVLVLPQPGEADTDGLGTEQLQLTFAIQIPFKLLPELLWIFLGFYIEF